MSQNGLAEYHDFMRFRDEFLNRLFNISIAHEERFLEAFSFIETIDQIKARIKNRLRNRALIERGVASEKWVDELANKIKLRQIKSEKKSKRVRPVAVIKTDEQFAEYGQMIAEWVERVKCLNQLDPDTYPLNATAFSPVPEIISGARKISIANNKATAVRNIKKDVLIRRYRDYIAGLRNSTGWVANALIEQLQTEMQAMEVDDETEYVLRNDKNNETALIIYPYVGKQYRKRVPMSGVIIDDRFNDVEISPAKKLAERTDTFERLGVNEIQCTLPRVGGKLYPKGEVERAKRIARESKIPLGSN